MNKVEIINNWMQEQVKKIDFTRNGDVFEAEGAPFSLDFATMKALMTANFGNTLFAHEFNPSEYNDDGSAVLCEKEMNVRFIPQSFHARRMLSQGGAVFYDHSNRAFRPTPLSQEVISTETMAHALSSLAAQANKTVKEIVRWEKQTLIAAGWRLRVKMF